MCEYFICHSVYLHTDTFDINIVRSYLNVPRHCDIHSCLLKLFFMLVKCRVSQQFIMYHCHWNLKETFMWPLFCWCASMHQLRPCIKWSQCHTHLTGSCSLHGLIINCKWESMRFGFAPIGIKLYRVWWKSVHLFRSCMGNKHSATL